MSTAIHGGFSFLAVSALVSASLFFAPTAGAQKTPPSPEQRNESVKVGETPEDHLAKATEYAKKASSYREEAAMHRRMYADYAKTVAFNPKAPENPWLRKMRDHCDRFIKDAERLAADSDTFAEFHRLRAAELQGK